MPSYSNERREAVVAQTDQGMSWRDQVPETGAKPIVLERDIQSPWFHHKICKV